MVTIEQVRLLESRVIKTIEFVDHVTEENALLKNKLESCQKRIDELEVLIARFKEDQAKIEDGIVSALDRLNKFEDDMDKGISKAKAETVSAAKSSKKIEPDADEVFVLKDKPYDPESDGKSANGEQAAVDNLEIF